MRILKPYITGTLVETQHAGGGGGAKPGGDGDGARPTRGGSSSGGTIDLDELVEQYASDKDHENALLSL